MDSQAVSPAASGSRIREYEDMVKEVLRACHDFRASCHEELHVLSRTDEPHEPSPLTRQLVKPLDHHQGSCVLRWLSDRDDYYPYFISQGGRWTHVVTPEVDTPPVSPATSSRKANSVISDTASYDDENETRPLDGSTTSSTERGASVKRRSEIEVPSANIDDLLRDVTEALRNLAHEYSHNEPTACSPTSQSSKRRRDSDRTQYPHASQPSVSQGKRARKEPVPSKTPHRGGEPSVDVRELEPEIRRTRIRCFYHFGLDAQGNDCESTWPGIRDLIRHWKSHGVHYCSTCSRSFDRQNEFIYHKLTHQEHRICVDIECVNRVEPEMFHLRCNGCVDLNAVNLDNKRKYYSLFRLALPGVTQPAWNLVEINPDNGEDDGATNNSEPYESAIQSPEPMNLDGIPSLFPHDDVHIIPSTSGYAGHGVAPSGGGQMYVGSDPTIIAAMQEQISELRAAFDYLLRNMQRDTDWNDGTVNPGNL